LIGACWLEKRRRTRSSVGHRRVGKVAFHARERPTRTKDPHRPPGQTEQIRQPDAWRRRFDQAGQHMPQQEERRGKLQIRSKRLAGFLPQDAMPPKMPQPGRRPLHHPTVTIPPQRPSVLRTRIRPATALLSLLPRRIRSAVFAGCGGRSSAAVAYDVPCLGLNSAAGAMRIGDGWCAGPIDFTGCPAICDGGRVRRLR